MLPRESRRLLELVVVSAGSAMFGRYVLAWVGLFAVGFANGTLRALGYGRFMSEHAGHVVSSVTAIALIGAAVWAIHRIWPFASTRHAVGVGLMWLVLTVAAEFLMGHYLIGHSWERLLHDYNVPAGRVWVFVLLWTAAAPAVIRRFSPSRTSADRTEPDSRRGT